MKDFIWIFNSAALGSGIDGGFSLEYHISAARMKVAPEALVGSRVWLVLRDGNESYLYGFLSPSVIELYQEGKYKGDFLVQCEPFSSVRLLPRLESRAPWSLPRIEDTDIRECTQVEAVKLAEVVRANQRVSFAGPSRGMTDAIPKTAFVDLEHAVPDQLMLTLRMVAFGDISRPRSVPDSVSAFGAVVLSILKITHPQFNKADVIALLARLDPFSGQAEGGITRSPEEIMRALSSLSPIVDTFLIEIDPDKISPRTFVARATSSTLEWLDKTNGAEQAHETIVKDVVLYLKSRGFKTYKTRSFDLFAKKGDIKFLFEIKSANSFNSMAQGEKGILQLLRYSIVLTREKSQNIRSVVLLQDSGQLAVQEYLSKMASKAESELWLYDKKRQWPSRVFNVSGHNLDF